MILNKNKTNRATNYLRERWKFHIYFDKLIFLFSYRIAQRARNAVVAMRESRPIIDARSVENLGQN